MPHLAPGNFSNRVVTILLLPQSYFLYIIVHYTYGMLYHVHTNWSYPPPPG